MISKYQNQSQNQVIKISRKLAEGTNERKVTKEEIDKQVEIWELKYNTSTSNQRYCIGCGKIIMENVDKCECNGPFLKEGMNKSIAEKAREKLNLKLVNLSERYFLLYALNEKELSYSDLAHAYLEISRVLYEVFKNNISKNVLKLPKLEKGFKDLLKLVQNIQEKETPITNKASVPESTSIWNNKNNLFDSLSFYETIMNNLKTNKSSFWFSFLAIILSGIGLYISFQSLIIAIK